MYRLGWALGIWNIEQPGGLMDLMDEDQLDGWIQFHALEPWGPRRDDLRAGLIASLIHNTNIDPSKTSPSRPQDFLGFFHYVEPESVGEEITVESWLERKRQLKEELASVRRGSGSE